MGFSIVKGDLFELKYDAIVIPTQPSFKLEGDIGGRARKICGDVIDFEIAQLKNIKLTECVVISAYNLPCNKLILVADPMWKDGKQNEEEDLRESYLNCLNTAMDFELGSIAFPLLSTGAYKFPKRKAIEIAIETITDFVEDNDIDVALVIYDENTYSTYRDMFKKHTIIGGHLNKHTEQHIKNIEEERKRFGWYLDHAGKILEKGASKTSFSETLKYFMVQKSLTKGDCYLGVLSKEAFQNIYNGKSNPKKYTAVALGINMGLEPHEINKLLEPIGARLDEEIERDRLITMAYWECGEGIDGVNEVLSKNNYPPLKSIE